MTAYIIPSILIAFIIFISIILIRTIRFKPHPQPEPLTGEIHLNRNKILADMQKMIRCKTVSHMDEKQTDFGEFEKFRRLLEEQFPLVNQYAKKHLIGKTGVLYQLQGESAEKPSVCMAHYDVVPVDEEAWEKPAFAGILEGDVLWGRGTLDTKGTVCGIMEAAEQLLSEGYVPKRDLYLAFCGDEETTGESCEAVVDWFWQHGIRPELVLDEGGAVVENVFPGVPGECAMIGIAEKGYINLQLTLKSNGGHSATPPEHTVVGKLAQAMVAIEAHPFPAQMTKPVAAMFDTLGRHSGFGYRMIFANIKLFQPILFRFCQKAGDEFNAMMRSTCALTKMEGSKAFNVLPPSGQIGMNLRLLGEDTVDSAIAYLKKVVKNDDIIYAVQTGTNPSDSSDVNCEQWELLRQVVHTTFPQAIVSPYLMMACSDARQYCRITDKVYRFSPMKMSNEERALIHGHNERIPVDTLLKTVEFYIRLMRCL